VLHLRGPLQELTDLLLAVYAGEARMIDHARLFRGCYGWRTIFGCTAYTIPTTVVMLRTASMALAGSMRPSYDVPDSTPGMR